MTANVGRWETVVSRSKKGPSTFAPKVAEKKRIGEKMPKLEDLVVLQPMKESQTMFGAFSGVKENGTKRVKSQGQGDDGSQKLSPKSDGANQKKKNGEKPQNKATKPLALSAAVKLLSQDALEKALGQTKKAFPNSTLLWLKDMASFLNYQFEAVPFEDPVHANERPDFPSCELPTGIKQVVVRTLQGATNNVLEIFFHHCVISMVTDLSKGLSFYGYQIVVQLLAYMSPAVVLGDLNKYSELLAESQGRPLRCLAILWALGQCGHKDLPTAIRVFFEIMFPSISTKQCAPFILGHLDYVLKAHSKKLHHGKKSLGLTGYFTLLDFFNQAKPACLTSVEMKKFTKSILPKLKMVAYGTTVGGNAPTTPTNLHLFFPSYLSRVDTTGPLKGEFLTSLIECLVKDPKGSFSVWRELYIKHLPQSGTLLKYLVDNQGSKTTEQIDKGQLKETIQSFQITNEELRATAGSSPKSEPAGLGLCEENCLPLLAKTEAAIEASSAVGKGKKWIFRLLFLVVGFLLIDLFVLSRGVVEESLAFKGLLAAGLSTAHMDQIVAKTEVLAQKSQHALQQLCLWIGDDLPALYADAVDAILPHAASLRQHASNAVVAISEVSTKAVDAAVDLWTDVAARVESELSSTDGWTAIVLEKLTFLFDSTLENGRWAWAHLSAHAAEVWAWLATQWTLVKAALESNEAAMGIWLAVVEAWELLIKIATDLATQGYALVSHGVSELQSMIK